MSTIYDRIGGEASVATAVNEFYDRILSDSRLAPRFEGINLPRLRKHQMEFLTAALGGPQAYTGGDLSEAHAPLGITDDEFERVIDHLSATLAHVGVDTVTTDEIVVQLMGFRPTIVHQGA